MNSAPLLIVAFDAGDAAFIEGWSREGYLPSLTSLMRRGCWGRIGGQELISTQGAWLSFFSGVSPLVHGHYFARQLKPGTYDLQSVTPRDAQAIPFWSHLHPTSHKVAIIDAFETETISGLPGLQLGNWAVQQQFNTPPLPVLAEPPGLLQEVSRLVGKQIQIDVFDPKARVSDDLDAYQRLLGRIEQKARLAEHYLRQDRYDLIVIGFSEAHTAAHRFWNYRGTGLLNGQAAGANVLRDAIRDIYQSIDRQIGRVVEQVPDSNVFVVSLFGMKDLYSTAGLIKDFCRQLGYQVMAGATSQPPTPLSLVRHIIPASWRARVSRLLPPRVQDHLGTDLFRKETDWSRTRAFPLPSLTISYVRVNLRGREPQGVVEPGREYDRLLDEIEADLRQLIDVRSGQPAVETVTRTAQALCGDPPSVLPDLCIEWRAAPYCLERVAHPQGELVQPVPYYNRSSGHTFFGFLAAAGPSVRSAGHIDEVAMLELAPTFQSLLGVPPTLTGRRLDRILNQAAVAAPDVSQAH